MNKNKTNWVAVLTMMFLFGMIAFVTNLAAPLGQIWQGQDAINGNKVLGMMGNMMNFLAYLFMGIPAGKLVANRGYKVTALIGVAVGFFGILIQFLSGAVATGMTSYIIYLLGAFVAGFAVCILNTVVNPMLNTLGGGGNKGNQLVQVGGSFNSLLGTLTPMLVGALVGDVVTKKTIADGIHASGTELTQISAVNPVLFIAMAVFVFAFVVIYFVNITDPEQPKTSEPVGNPLKYKHFVYGAIAIFLYVGVEVGIPATLIDYLSDPKLNILKSLGHDAPVKIAGFIAGTYWLLMLVGRLVSSFISSKVSSRTQLTAVCAVALAFVMAAIFTPASVTTKMPAFMGAGAGFQMVEVPMSALFLVLCGLCTSVMWGVIYNLAVEGLGSATAKASGFFMTMVVGGGVLPLLQSAVAGSSAGHMASYWIIVAALAYMLWFALFGSKVKSNK
jgi:FHS family L-fucose permease-like MFS transporter